MAGGVLGGVVESLVLGSLMEVDLVLNAVVDHAVLRRIFITRCLLVNLRQFFLCK